MSDKTNDEKLSILQERLAQIKEKQENPPQKNAERRDVTEGSTSQVEESRDKKEPKWGLEEEKKKSSWVKYFILFVCGGLIGFYVYNNIDSNSFVAEVPLEEVKEELTSTKIEYNLNLEGNQLAIINSFEDESSAKAMVNNLTIKGFKCNYFFLPNKSNSTEEVYKVFIGPYENLEEVNQWKQNINGEVEILNL